MPGVVVAIFGCPAQAMDDFQPGSRQFDGPQLHLPIELVGNLAEMILVGLESQGVADARHQVDGVDRLGEKVGGAQVQGRSPSTCGRQPP